ncbi:MAG: hypothetical protein AAGC57_14600 [Pseudomonadota bacterium]
MIWVWRLLPAALAFGAAALIWWGWEELGQLRGTPVWEFRYILLGIAAILGLGVLEAVLARLPRPPEDR